MKPDCPNCAKGNCLHIQPEELLDRKNNYYISRGLFEDYKRMYRSQGATNERSRIFRELFKLRQYHFEKKNLEIVNALEVALSIVTDSGEENGN